jgi:hypothetical protein
MSRNANKPKGTAARQAAELLATINRVRTKTDGCTFSPDFSFSVCCIAHDINYSDHPAGISRAGADKELRRCIASTGHPLLAWLYWSAVRIFGRTAWR